jgi:ankyrin repeat protein
MNDEAADDFYGAVLEGSIDRLKAYVTHRHSPNEFTATDNWNLLHRALVMPNHKIPQPVIQYLVAIGVDVNAKDIRGWTPLHFAARENQADILETLLKAGADPNVKHERGHPPISEALKAQPPVLESVEVLLKYGAKTEGDSFTARKLMEAVARPDKHAILALFDKYRPIGNP